MANPDEADPLYKQFLTLTGRDNELDTLELQKYLCSPLHVGGVCKDFSYETCRILMSTLDHNETDGLDFNEFKELLPKLREWQSVFYQYDKDRSGTFQARELEAALLGAGYTQTSRILARLARRYSNVNKEIDFDDFVSCLVRIQVLTELFKKHDTEGTGTAKFNYEDFMMGTL